MRNILAIIALVLVIAMTTVAVSSYDAGATKELVTVTNVVTQLRYVTTNVNNTVVIIVSQSPEQVVTFTVQVYHESYGVLTLEADSRDNCTVTVLPVSTSTTTYTQYLFPFNTTSIENRVFNATIITVTAVQGQLIDYVNGTYYSVPIFTTTESASSNLLKTITITGVPTPSGSYRTYVTSTCPEFTTQG